jgi:CRISPR-associated protein Cmr6
VKGVRGFVLPLYREAREASPRYTAKTNSGLWYDKFFDLYGPGWSLQNDDGKSDNENPKTAWISRVCERPVGNPILLKETTERFSRLVLSLGGELRLMATEWRFVTGLGRDHPVENGFAWHHTLGVPFLPGSSLKGVVRTWASFWQGVPEKDVERIFGPEGEGREKRVGTVIFFDVLPPRPVELHLEVMTSHYAPYYQSGYAIPPGDWFAPVPVPFLTVAPGQRFLFGVAPRRANNPECREDCARVAGWLEEALAEMGAGAKTAVGYGRFVRRRAEESRWVEQIRHRPGQSISRTAPVHPEPPAGSVAGEPESPILAEMRADGYGTDHESFMNAMTTKWIPKLGEPSLPAEGKQEIARLLREWYLDFRPEQWKRPNKKNATKIAEINKHLGEG